MGKDVQKSPGANSTIRLVRFNQLRLTAARSRCRALLCLLGPRDGKASGPCLSQVILHFGRAAYQIVSILKCNCGGLSLSYSRLALRTHSYFISYVGNSWGGLYSMIHYAFFLSPELSEGYKQPEGCTHLKVLIDLSAIPSHFRCICETQYFIVRIILSKGWQGWQRSCYLHPCQMSGKMLEK